MKRRLPACLAAMLLLGLLPGTAAASAPNIDISNDASSGSDAGHTFAQTFTADETGLMTAVDLKLAINGSEVVNLDVEQVDGSGHPNGTILATGGAFVTGSSAFAPTWWDFPLSNTVSVVAGVKYAIKFTTVTVRAYSNEDNPYAGGAALQWGGSSWADLTAFNSDFGFQTYVDTVQTTVVWSHPTVVGGVSTPLTLTITMTFVNADEVSHYTAILLSALPSWFNVSTPITCSSSVPLVDCTVDRLQGTPSLLQAASTNIGAVVTFTLSGTANPAADEVGPASTAMAEGCLVIVPQQPTVRPNARTAAPGCADGSGTVQVVAAPAQPTPTTADPTSTPAPTLPPTSTTNGPTGTSSGGFVLVMPLGLMGLFAAALAFVAVRRRRFFSN